MSKTKEINQNVCRRGINARKYIVFGVIFTVCLRLVLKNCLLLVSVFEKILQLYQINYI
jgi:hypothetical protein